MNNNNRFKENADDKKNNIDKECLKKTYLSFVGKISETNNSISCSIY